MNMYQIGPCTENDMYRNGSCYVLNWTLYQSGCSVPKKTYQKTTEIGLYWKRHVPNGTYST